MPIRCAVVGAANVDLGGFPAGRLSMQDSNPGRILMSAGGVGRNIACNLAQLGCEVQLIAPLGGDGFADVIRANCARAGVDLSLSPTFPDAASSAYLYIADARGDMQLAVNDMDVCARLTPAIVAPLIGTLNAADCVVVEANLPEATLAYLSENVTAPLIADAVSTAKAARLKPALAYLAVLKPNAIEAEALTGVPVTDAESALEAARALTAMGVRRAFITLGELGVACADSSHTAILPGAPVRMVSATGAGDAFTAALAWALARGMALSECAAAGLAAASIAIESEGAVNPLLTEAALTQRIQAIS